MNKFWENATVYLVAVILFFRTMVPFVAIVVIGFLTICGSCNDDQEPCRPAPSEHDGDTTSSQELDLSAAGMEFGLPSRQF